MLVRDTLNPMEMVALHAVARGLTKTEAAQERWVSVHTIDSQRKKMRARLGARNDAHAVAIGFTRGILTSEDLAA